MIRRTALALLTLALLSAPARSQQQPQQILQTGALGAPTAVVTQDNQWSSLISILSTPDIDAFIEDPSTDAWLSRNAQSFLDRGQYTITIVSFYKTPHPCHEDQVRAGFSDAADVNACSNDRYGVRRITVDAPQNSVTVLLYGLVAAGGALDPATVRRENRTRAFGDLGTDAQKALSEATKLIANEARTYAARQHPPSQ